MTYCLGIHTHQGLVMASDCRTNAGYDQVNVCRKLHTFVIQGERVFVVLTSGSLSLGQSVLTHARREFDSGDGLAAAPTPYDAARVLGDEIRRVSDKDRAALERDDYRFNIHMISGRPGSRRAGRTLYDIPAGKPTACNGGITVSSDWRVQVRKTDSGSRCSVRRYKPRRCRPIRYDLNRLNHAIQYNSWPPNRSGDVRNRYSGDHKVSTLHAQRPGPAAYPESVGRVTSASGPAITIDRLFDDPPAPDS